MASQTGSHINILWYFSFKTRISPWGVGCLGRIWMRPKNRQ